MNIKTLKYNIHIYWKQRFRGNFRLMKFKILHTEASLGWGGQEIRIFQEAAGMRKRGHNFIIAAQPESRLIEYAKKEGFKTISIKFKRRNFLNIILFFKKLIEKEKIDIVNTHSSKDSWLVLPAARTARNKPLTLRTRHLSTKIHGGILNRFLYNQLPHFVITTGEAIRGQMVEVNGFNADKIISIPTGIDVDIFKPEGIYNDIREDLKLEKSTPLVGSVSVIRSWKGLDYLVKAVPLILKEMPKTRFIIAGEGPYKKTLLKTIDETGVSDKICLLGHREDTLNVFNSIDILAHPSYANEGVSQSVLQAMAMKKPVVASDIPPLKEVVIENETGILTPVKNPGSIAAAIIRLLRDKELSKKLGENGRRLVSSSYSSRGMLNKIESLYRKSLIENNG